MRFSNKLTYPLLPFLKEEKGIDQHYNKVRTGKGWRNGLDVSLPFVTLGVSVVRNDDDGFKRCKKILNSRTKNHKTSHKCSVSQLCGSVM